MDELLAQKGRFSLAILDMDMKDDPEFPRREAYMCLMGGKAEPVLERGLMLDSIEDIFGYQAAYSFSCCNYCRYQLLEDLHISPSGCLAISRAIQDTLAMPPHQQVDFYEKVNNGHLHSVVESSQAPLFVIDAERRIWFANLAAHALFKMPSQFLKNHIFDELISSSKSQADFLRVFDFTQHHLGKQVEIECQDFWGRPFSTLILMNRIFGPDIPDGMVGLTIIEITARKKAEKALQESNERFNQLADHIREVFWLTDWEEHKVIFCSSAYEKIWGASLESLYNNPMQWIESIHPEDRKRVAQAFIEKSPRGEFVEEFRILRPDGSIRWILDKAFPIQDETGKTYRLAGIAEDITERKQVEEAVRESEERFRSTFEQAAVGIAHVGLDGRFLRLNKRFCDIVGYTKKEMEARTFQDITHPDDLKDDLYNVDLALQGTIPTYSMEKRYIRKNGNFIWVNLTVSLLRKPSGEPHYFISVVEDITSRKKAEEALRESRDLARVLLNSPVDGCYLLSPDGNILDLNESAARRLNLTPAEAIGRNAFQILPPEISAARRVKVNEVIQTGRSLQFEDERDGHLLSSSIYPVLDAEGQVRQIAVFIQDITEQRRAEKERRMLEAQIQQTQKLESLGLLAGGIAHDFNNLLVSILGHADLALLDLPQDAPSRQSIEQIQQASKQAAELCSQMLAYSGKGRFRVVPVDLSHLAAEMMRMLEVSISKKAYLRCHFAENIPPIKADTTQIRQVLMNLITNASEALGEENGVIAITTGSRKCNRHFLQDCCLGNDLPEGTYTFIEVADTGCGMDEETQARIFDPFYTTKFTGRGLGMAAVMGIVKGHKGAIRIESKPNQGTTITVLFPVITAATADREESGQEPSADWKGTGTVLVIEDEPSVRSLAERMLKRMGFQVLLAEDGIQGVETFRKNADQIACVLLDLTMPQMDGRECHAAIREIREDARIIMTSGYNEEEVIGQLNGSDLNGFIQKPFEYKMLIAALKRALGHESLCKEGVGAKD